MINLLVLNLAIFIQQSSKNDTININDVPPEVAQQIEVVRKFKPDLQTDDLSSGILDLSGTRFKDDDFESIYNLIKYYNISKINISNTMICGSFLKEIPTKNSITLLDMYHSSINDEALSNLRDYPSLSVLRIGRTRVTGDGLPKISYIKTLTELDISELGIEDADLAFIKGLEKIRDLNISHNSLTDQGIKNILHLKSLDMLFLSDNKVGNESVKDIAKSLSSLTLLNIRNNDISNLDHIKLLKDLELLDMSGTKVDKIQFRTLSQMKSLKHLWVSNMKIGSVVLGDLAKCPQLESVEIGPVDLLCDDLVKFLHDNKMCHLTIRYNQATQLERFLDLDEARVVFRQADEN